MQYYNSKNLRQFQYQYNINTLPSPSCYSFIYVKHFTIEKVRLICLTQCKRYLLSWKWHQEHIEWQP